MIATLTGAAAWDAASDVAAHTATAATATVRTAAVFQLRSLCFLTGGALLPLEFSKVARFSRSIDLTFKRFVDGLSLRRRSGRCRGRLTPTRSTSRLEDPSPQPHQSIW